jgi:hypothetical protein
MQAIVEIAARLEAKLFYKDEPKPEIPSGGAAPAAPGAFPALEIQPHKLTFAAYDGKEDPLPWLNRCEQFFRVNGPPTVRKHGMHLTI